MTVSLATEEKVTFNRVYKKNLVLILVVGNYQLTDSYVVQVLVAEPSVPDTISILRGLKEKYEGHHGVRLLDRALVVAAQLSSRYITGRFLPDKAIDLIDEACANVRVQLDSQPEEIDVMERRRVQLEVELHALEKEKDKASKARLLEVSFELVYLRCTAILRILSSVYAILGSHQVFDAKSSPTIFWICDRCGKNLITYMIS